MAFDSRAIPVFTGLALHRITADSLSPPERGEGWGIEDEDEDEKEL